MSLLTPLFPDNVAYSYEAIRAATYSNYGGADLGEVMAISNLISSGDEEAWMSQWKSAADRAVGNAETSIGLGNRIGAREAFLRASNYYRTAEFFRREDPFNDEISHDLYRKSTSNFVTAMKLADYYFEEIEIPYEGKMLPGYFVRCDASPVPRNTIIFNGGFDSIKEEGWFAIGAAALQQGYNFLAFDGPGQGLAIRRDRFLFRPDWENVVKPVMDYTISRPDVNSEKIVIFGWSMGGYLVARGATAEHRAAAIILDDGVFDMASAFKNILPTELEKMVSENRDPEANSHIEIAMGKSSNMKWAINNGKWTFGATSNAECVRKAGDYTLEGRIDMIKTPTLVLDAPDDHFFKGQPAEVEKRLNCKKALVGISAVEGGSSHCHLGTFSRLHQVIFDHLAQIL